MPMKMWRFVAVILVALLTGLAFAHVLEQPAKMLYEGELYLTLQKSLYAGWGPPGVGGFLEPVAILATLSLLVASRGSRAQFRMTLAAAVALLLAFPVVFYLLVAPSNAAFAVATLDAIPHDWTDLRARWELGHTVRFVLQLVALGLLVLSAEAAGPSRRVVG